MSPASRAFGLALLSLLGVTACGSQRQRSEVQHGALGGGTVARVGDAGISVSLVANVAAAEKLAPSAALALLVDDALAACAARAAGLDRTPDELRAIVASLARATALRVRDRARAMGPPTDAEVEALTAKHWLEVDLPEQRRVIHAVVLKPKRPSPASERSAVTLAQELAASEAGATSPEDFKRRAKELQRPDDLSIKIEELEPFVADGRVASAGGAAMDPEFAKAAFRLSFVGATSGVVATPFGWHVIRLIEILPEHRVPLEARRRLFKDEVEATRAHDEVDRLREELGKQHSIEVVNGVDDSMTTAAMTVLGTGGTAIPGSPTTP